MAVNTAPINPKALAQAKRAERRRRTRRIRQGVAAGTITLFVAFFSTIYAQMAGGSDPALSASGHKATVVATTTRTTSSSGSGTTSSSGTGTTSSTSSTGSTAASSSPAPVTTQQS